MNPRKPEIMSPAGYWPQLHAAIEAGADSVYFGLKHFTARAKVGFSLAELPEVMRTLHRRGVKGFVTFNTLIFDHELLEAARTIAAIASAGADALIVQDLGVLDIARNIAPDLELHASTQMSITDAAGVRLAQKHGVSRVTLARELSLAEVRKIREATDAELEIFVHGALCVAYSGQCFSSEAWGGRSANRGQCAQACRLPYDLLVDGHQEELGDARYLLSPGDLMGLHHVAEMVDIGIGALKIEGRYKDAEYVAVTTAAYRKAVDRAATGLSASVSRDEELRLEQVYSRGLGPWFIQGTNHQEVVRGRAPRHRGVAAGHVAAVLSNSILVEPGEIALKPGDGIVFDAADWRSPEEPEEGGRIYEVVPRRDNKQEISFANGAIDTGRIRVGDLIWRTSDPELDRLVRPLLDPAAPVARQPVRIRAVAVEREPLRTEWNIDTSHGVRVEVDSSVPLGTAQNRVLDESLLQDQFGRLGNTPYQLAAIELELHGRPFAPASLLNAVRREATERLAELQAQRPVRTLRNADAVLEQAIDRVRTAGCHQSPSEPQIEPKIHVLVRNGKQLEAALSLSPASITLDYLDLYGLKPSVERLKSQGVNVRVASPRVLKPGEDRILDFMRRLDCPLLLRGSGMIDTLSTDHRDLALLPDVFGDFSLNVANAVTAGVLLDMGLQRITPGHDLNAAQISSLAAEVPSSRLEVIAFGHLPVFHTEHCVFCRFLSTGTTYKDCGRPCEKHELAVRDQQGRAHPVIADVGCRNTVFGAEAQEASAHLPEWLDAGIRHYRLEFAHETEEETRSVIEAFQDFFGRRLSAEQLGRELRRKLRRGTTEGSFFVPQNHLTLPVLQ